MRRRAKTLHDVLTKRGYIVLCLRAPPGEIMSPSCLRLFFAALFAVGHTPAITQPAAPQAAAVQASEPLKARIAELVPIFKGGGDYDAFFAPAFRAQVPKSKFDEVTAQVFKAIGPVVAIESITPTSPYAATLSVGFRDGVAAMRISVAASPPHAVDGLRVTGVSGRETNLGEVVDKLRAFPGTTGFALAKLGGDAPQMLAALNADRPLAIGSAFKLVILAELVRATNAAERNWSDLVTLDGRPLPGGAYAKSPAGTKVSLEELASKMIAVSDNSATDILLTHLGRKKVEAILPAVGIARPAGMRPFLTTLEAFKLKGIAKGALGTRYAALDEGGRRKMLDGEIANQPLTAIDAALFQDGKPKLIDTVEWFASASDMVRVMDWLRRNSGTNPTARTILSKNLGVGGSANRWRYIGFKGGSEPGVINMTLLLQGKDESWYALAGSWNNPAAAVDNVRFAALIAHAAELAAKP